MSLLEVTLGPVALGVFLNTYLYGIVTHQYAVYVNTRFKDPLWIKLTVLALFLLDTFHSASLIYMAWYYLVESFGNLLALLSPIWPYSSTIFVTVTTALLAHVFLIYRTVRLTNKFVYIPLLLLSFGSFGTGMGCGVRAYLSVKREADMSTINLLMTSWLSLELTVDVLIAGTLIWVLSRSRTGFRKSDAIINKLIRTSVQTGMFSGVFAMLGLTFYLARPDTQFFGLFGLPVARLYTNTLMDTLLCREGLRGILDQPDVSLSFASTGSHPLQSSNDIRTDIDFTGHGIWPMSPIYSPKQSSPVTEQTVLFKPEARAE